MNSIERVKCYVKDAWEDLIWWASNPMNTEPLGHFTFWVIVVISGLVFWTWVFCTFAPMVKYVFANEYTNEQIVNAIYLAEGGANTRHPYGILAKYKHTTPRTACLNTVRHARKDFDGKGDFILFLQRRYAPIGVKNDPKGLNHNWYNNVKHFLERGNNGKLATKH